MLVEASSPGAGLGFCDTAELVLEYPLRTVSVKLPCSRFQVQGSPPIGVLRIDLGLAGQQQFHQVPTSLRCRIVQWHLIQHGIDQEQG